MRRIGFAIAAAVILLWMTACTVTSILPAVDDVTEIPSGTEPESPAETTAPTMEAAPEVTLPPVTGPDPSYEIAAFYYPWYRNPDVDGHWDHWGETRFSPPQDIASDYYPSLGTYSIADPAVLGQHFAWLREAGVGVIVSSWWGRYSPSDEAVFMMLDIADQYGIKVAFHIEPYGGRTDASLLYDVKYIYDKYGEHPAFFRTAETSRWSMEDKHKGLFYLWSSISPSNEVGQVEPDYWQEALDEIHALPDGGIVLADQTTPDWVLEGHFDGSYNYGVLNQDPAEGYAWGASLPPGAWFVPGINPGFSAERINYPPEVNTERLDGLTYDLRWQAVLDGGVEPVLVTVTTFNEWHEGTQIEPAAVGADNGRGYFYKDYGALAPEGYLDSTHDWAYRYLSHVWPEAELIRVTMKTTSDWTDLALSSGAAWIQPEVISVQGNVLEAGKTGNLLVLSQPLDNATAGSQVEVVCDFLITGWEPENLIEFVIERGHLGTTHVELQRFEEGQPVTATILEWGGISGGERNERYFMVPPEDLFGETP
ncbi:MAG: hypothetical protein JXA25_00200 [Anaerolineales bacterium]|nr:hypothetical protein [Anaerolineales bacterium]